MEALPIRVGAVRAGRGHRVTRLLSFLFPALDPPSEGEWRGSKAWAAKAPAVGRTARATQHFPCWLEL